MKVWKSPVLYFGVLLVIAVIGLLLEGPQYLDDPRLLLIERSSELREHAGQLAAVLEFAEHNQVSPRPEVIGVDPRFGIGIRRCNCRSHR